MKISKSKVTLAAKIKSSGFEWPQFGKWATQDKDGEIFISGGDLPTLVRMSGEVNWEFDAPYKSAGKVEVGLNWFQCILSRDEYFHLYTATETAPEPVAEAKLAELVAACEALVVVLSAAGVEPESDVAKADAEAKPPIEQLASDYRNAKDYAERKQWEADAAKADADAKLKVLELAGEALGLLVSPITEKQEPELVITDWRDLQVGDEVEYLSGKRAEMAGRVMTVKSIDPTCNYGLHVHLGDNVWPAKWRFIRRP